MSAVRLEEYCRRCSAKLCKRDADSARREPWLDEGPREMHMDVFGGLLAKRSLEFRREEISDGLEWKRQAIRRRIGRVDCPIGRLYWRCWKPSGSLAWRRQDGGRGVVAGFYAPAEEISEKGHDCYGSGTVSALKGSVLFMPSTAKAWSPFDAPDSAGCAPSPATGNARSEPPLLSDARKILILDDDQEFLDTYGRILSRLPSRPEVRVATCAARALALLEAESFALLITDLRMPRIDGFQVLLSARRRFPSLRTVAITGLGDQQYRARAYASGIDLYTEKPTTPTEIRLFGECVDALLAQGAHDAGFRGIQSKSLMDLIQIECLSQNLSVLRITHGSMEGCLWIQGGDVIDAEVQDLRSEEAFKTIFAWKTGHFEIMPGDAQRPRTIYNSYESLLLDSAQTLDETTAAGGNGDGMLEVPSMSRTLHPLAGVRGVESLLLICGPGKFESWGLENPEEFAGWTHRVLHEFNALGETLNAGPLRAVEAAGSVRGVVLLTQNGQELMAGIDRKLAPRFVRAAGKELATHLGKE